MRTSPTYFAGKLRDMIGELRYYYGLKDETDVDYELHHRTLDHQWVITAKFSDGCRKELVLDDSLSGLRLEEIAAKWLRERVIEHGYRPLYAQELHGPAVVPKIH